MSGRDYIPRAEIAGGDAIGANLPIFAGQSPPITPRATEQASTVIISGVVSAAGNLNLVMSAPITLAASLVGAVLADTFFRFKVRLPTGSVIDLEHSVGIGADFLLAIDEVRGPVG